MGIANGKDISTKQLCDIMEEAYRRGKAVLPQGKVATYIPELGKADPGALGISLCARDGWHFNIGDTNRRFTIQSISKVISLALALELLGMDKVFERVDMEPSGEAFNSLIDLDLISNHPMNPMINSGAITVANMLLGKMSFEEIQDVFRKVCEDPEMESNEAVFGRRCRTCPGTGPSPISFRAKGFWTTGWRRHWNCTLVSVPCRSPRYPWPAWE